MNEPWTTISSEILGDYQVFRLRRDVIVSPRTGDSHAYFALETADWVNVIPVTPEGQIVLVRQYRHAIEEVMLEIPGGMVEEGNESPAATAAREMLEETGYAAETIASSWPG